MGTGKFHGYRSANENKNCFFLFFYLKRDNTDENLGNKDTETPRTSLNHHRLNRYTRVASLARFFSEKNQFIYVVLMRYACGSHGNCSVFLTSHAAAANHRFSYT